MSAEQTRSVIQQWASALNTVDNAKLAGLAAPDATHWIAGLKEKIPYAGTVPYAERLTQMSTMFGQMKKIEVTVIEITVEGNTGILEIEAHGEGPSAGQIYDNNAILKFVVKDGKIQSLREYVDFFTVFKYLGKEPHRLVVLRYNSDLGAPIMVHTLNGPYEYNCCCATPTLELKQRLFYPKHPGLAFTCKGLPVFILDSSRWTFYTHPSFPHNAIVFDVVCPPPVAGPSGTRFTGSKRSSEDTDHGTRTLRQRTGN
ncbi:hypothetical protein NLJ89_g8808 [Agrocybe chaxingu]|uniref:SnoaL-like domain-containing protein n=1 Tax=Agrocybe chaxingu TaxID=84603 RepID=A0A9W8JTP8_9AGAR|nr:hypothetical protein NLJ89_g8808 [Agrocybe chaxingu]